MSKIKINEDRAKAGALIGKALSPEGQSPKRIKCVLISEGLGNLADRNYYTADAIKSAPPVYEGKKAYLDHPTPTEQQEQPGRSVTQTAGHYEEVQAVQGADGWELQGYFVPEDTPEVTAKIAHALEYKRRYPDKDYIAISINGDGEGVEMDYADFIKLIKPPLGQMAKIKQVEGLSIYVINKFTDAVSADLVTEAGARGRFLTEQQKANKRRIDIMNFLEAFKAFIEAARTGNKKLMEKAEADIKTQLEGEDEDEKRESAEAKHTEALVKAMLQAKKEMKKESSESDEAYEARCMKQAKKEMKKSEAAEAKKKAESEDEDEKKEAKAKKEAAAAKAKKDAAADDDGDEDDDTEAKKKEKAKKEAAEAKKKGEGESEDEMEKMAAKLEKLQAENESLKKEAKKGKKEAAESASVTEEETEAALNKIKIKEYERKGMIDGLLQESGLPRRTTNVIKPLIEKAKDEKEMKRIIEGFVSATEDLIENEFIMVSRGGNPARSAVESDGTHTSNDDLFDTQTGKDL